MIGFGVDLGTHRKREREREGHNLGLDRFLGREE